MERFAIGHAAGEDLAAVVETCFRDLGQGPFGDGLGFVYATDHLADHLADIVQGLRDGTGVEQWVGCLGMGSKASFSTGRADLCAMARPHLRDAYLTLHAAEDYDYPDQYWPGQYILGKPAPRAE